ncbi:MAG: glycosyltransferase family 2 protein, partial [Gemmatimonadota bacterium]
MLHWGSRPGSSCWAELFGTGRGGSRSRWGILTAPSEATNLRECLPTLLDQDLGEGELEVIVVDDRSTDETWEVLQEFDCDVLRPVRGEPLPEGWSGKNWAAHQGYQRANHDWVLFTDADVAFGDDVLRAALSRAELD